MREDLKTSELTGFQERHPYDPSIDLRTDFVMVYGIDSSMPERVARWREAGYVVHLMTGVSWGGYQDYLNGEHDGTNHWDEAQAKSDGEPMLHGHSTDIPYMVPTLAYADYLYERIKPAVDAGVDSIHLEEPEFWDATGFSEAFKREWMMYYKRPWQPPDSSADAHYKGSKLKQYLYTRCLDRLCSALKSYAITRYGRLLRFYVPTHSLINYTQWGIISPESSLLEVPGCDGYIAQIWTGTSRTPNVYAGVRKERTFETAFLEYGIMQELTRGTDRRMWFLHDPIEDNPRYSWEDYRANYQCTLVASLLHPDVASYEVAPWPNRIFNRPYRLESTGEKVAIPAYYATELLLAMNTLRDMRQEDVSWTHEGPRIGVLLADSTMYQRWQPDDGGKSQSEHKYDGTQAWGDLEEARLNKLNWSAFYGLALPVLKDGQPIRPVQLDNVRRFPGYLDDYDVLILSYEFMKPQYPDLHYALAGWVRNGGGLVYMGDGSDPYHSVEEWWNVGGLEYSTPAQHLFETLEIDPEDEAIHEVGKGRVRVLRSHPSEFTLSAQGAERMRGSVREVAEALGHRWTSSNQLVMRRGPYMIGAALDETAIQDELVVEGRFIDLLNNELPLVHRRVVRPGEQVWMLDLDRVQNDGPDVIASASRTKALSTQSGHFSFTSEAPTGVRVRTVISLPGRPKRVLVDGEPVQDHCFDEDAGILWLEHDGVPSGTDVRIEL